MTNFPILGACTRTTIGRAGRFRRMGRMHRGEHVLLAEELVVVLFRLGYEARIVIGIPRKREGRHTLECVVEAANSARAGDPSPERIGLARVCETKTQSADSAMLLRREHWT